MKLPPDEECSREEELENKSITANHKIGALNAEITELLERIGPGIPDRYPKLRALIGHLCRDRVRNERAAGEEAIEALERDIQKRRRYYRRKVQALKRYYKEAMGSHRRKIQALKRNKRESDRETREVNDRAHVLLGKEPGFSSPKLSIHLAYRLLGIPTTCPVPKQKPRKPPIPTITAHTTQRGIHKQSRPPHDGTPSRSSMPTA